MKGREWLRRKERRREERRGEERREERGGTGEWREGGRERKIS